MATERLSIQDACKYLGIKDRQLRNLMNDGLPYAGVGKRVRVLWPEARRWRDDQLRAEGARRAEPKDLAEAEQRKLSAEAQLAEVRLKREEGKLIDREDVREAAGTMFARFRVQALTLPQRWAPKVVGLRTLPEATAVLEAAVVEALTALSEEELCPPLP